MGVKDNVLSAGAGASVATAVLLFLSKKLARMGPKSRAPITSATAKPGAPLKGVFGAMNRPVAGAREQKSVPVGEKSLQLYSLATPNGQKVTVALEEMGLAYDAHTISIMKQEQFQSGFVDINPNSKIPALVDKEGPGGKEVNVFESGAILLYLAEKTGKLIPSDPAQRVECLNWLFFQHGAGPYFGQFGHFYKYAPEKIEYGIQRYGMEVQRLLDVLDKHLEGKQYILGDEYSIADIAWFPWVICLDVFYKAQEHLEVDSYKNVMQWVGRCMVKPATKRGMVVNKMS